MKKWLAVFCIMLFFMINANSTIWLTPQDNARELINKLDNKPGVLEISSPLQYGAPYSISEREIANTTKKRVCFGEGDFAKTDVILINEVKEEEQVTFTNKKWIDFRVAVMCHNGRTSLIEALERKTEIQKDGLPSCNLCDENKTCCAVIFLKKEADFSGIAIIVIIALLFISFLKIRINHIVLTLWIVTIPSLFFLFSFLLGLVYAIIIVALSLEVQVFWLSLILSPSVIPIILAVIFWKISKKEFLEKKKRLFAIAFLVLDIIAYYYMFDILGKILISSIM